VETVTSAIRPILSNHFKPALLARMTIVPYLTLGTEVIKDIVALKLGKVAKRLKDTHKMTFTYTSDVVDQIAKRCTEVETGARNIDFILHGTILPQISREILAGMGESGMPSQVTLGLAEDGTFDVRFQA
jgi:type VI secretion system protein VasG